MLINYINKTKFNTIIPLHLSEQDVTQTLHSDVLLPLHLNMVFNRKNVFSCNLTNEKNLYF